MVRRAWPRSSDCSMYSPHERLYAFVISPCEGDIVGVFCSAGYYTLSKKIYSLLSTYCAKQKL